MLASEQGSLEIVQELIRRGANVNLDDIVSSFSKQHNMRYPRLKCYHAVKNKLAIVFGTGWYDFHQAVIVSHKSVLLHSFAKGSNKDVWDVEKENPKFLYFSSVCLSIYQIFWLFWIYNFYFGSFNVFIISVVLVGISVCFGGLQFFSQMYDFIGVGGA